MDSNSKIQIEEKLNQLIGLPMQAFGRCLNLVWIHFGSLHTVVDLKEQPKEVGDYAIHLQCAWRLGQYGRILTGYEDIFTEPEGYTLQEDWDWQKHNRFDELIQKFWTEHTDRQPMVTAIKADLYGGFVITMTDELMLQVFPDQSSGECWRLFVPDKDAPHFVIYADGVSEE